MSTLTYQSQSNLTSMSSQSLVETGSRKSQWIVNRLFDVMFVCGMAPWILGALAYLVLGNNLTKTEASPQLTGLTIAFVVASFLIGESHQFTSILRYYFGAGAPTRGYIQSRIPIWVIYAGVGIQLPMLVAGAENLQFLSWLGNIVAGLFGTVVTTGMVLFPAVLAQHFCAQAKAVGLRYCGKSGYVLSPLMKSVLSVSTGLLWIAGACTIAMPFGFASSLPVEWAEVVASIGQNAGITAVILFAVPTLARGFMRKEWLPAGAALTWGNLALFMLLPFEFMVYVWLFVPVLFHASQHWTVAWDAERRAAMARRSRIQVIGDLCRFVLPVQAVTLAILFSSLLLFKLTLGPQGDSGTLELTWSMIVFYSHYFTDRIVWRPQITENPNVQKLLPVVAAP